MSAPDNSYPLNRLAEVGFSEDFMTAEPADGQIDTAEVGVLLSTLCRTCESCSQAIEAGELQGLLSWEPGRAMKLELASTGSRYEVWEGVSGWEDLDDVPWDQAMGTDCLLDVTRAEIIDRLCELPAVLWGGIRDLETSEWQECLCSTGFAHEKLLQATRLVLQLDVLLKGHGCPRGRLCLRYEQLSVWVWANAKSDYLMLVTGSELSLCDRGALMRVGEAFMLM